MSVVLYKCITSIWREKKNITRGFTHHHGRQYKKPKHDLTIVWSQSADVPLKMLAKVHLHFKENRVLKYKCVRICWTDSNITHKSRQFVPSLFAAIRRLMIPRMLHGNIAKKYEKINTILNIKDRKYCYQMLNSSTILLHRTNETKLSGKKNKNKF